MNFDFKFEETFGEFFKFFLNLRGKFCLKNRLMVWILKKKCVKKNCEWKKKKSKVKELNVLKKSKIKNKIIKYIKIFKKYKNFFNRQNIKIIMKPLSLFLKYWNN